MGEGGRLSDLIDPVLEDEEMDAKGEAVKMLRLGMLCIQDDSTSRPTMSIVVKALEGMIELHSVPSTSSPSSDHPFPSTTKPDRLKLSYTSLSSRNNQTKDCLGLDIEVVGEIEDCKGCTNEHICTMVPNGLRPEQVPMKDPKIYFKELAQLKLVHNLESYIVEFQRLAEMVSSSLERRLVILFMEGLLDPLRDQEIEHEDSEIEKASEVSENELEGATHNFIDEKLVARHGIQTREFEGMCVKVVDSYTLTCNKMITDLLMRLSDYEFKVDFYVVNMGDMDVVLGMTWVHAIEELTLNVKHMELRFEANGRKHVIKSITDMSF
ncbi:hypothetical protein SUGI_0718350 [Cryptomeria japonica]|nr:hypothetical protein SUGI_0718350 [Cryptomeria japonica]